MTDGSGENAPGALNALVPVPASGGVLALDTFRFATTRHMWFFDILFMSKYMKLLSQLKVYDIQLTKIETSKNQHHKVIM